jgi:hypothetical protein
LTLRLNDKERQITLRLLKARLDALSTEISQTDNPQFRIELGHQEKVIQGLIQRIEPLVAGRVAKRQRKKVAQ